MKPTIPISAYRATTSPAVDASDCGIIAHVADLQDLLGDETLPRDIVAASSSMRKLLRQAEKFAQTSATILLTGESGTGKEVVAHWIHQRSPRRGRPYVRVNCAALPETLMESEFFGHSRGAFTGAVDARKGRLASAGDGTILLDEISEISLPMQAKLLRVLEEEEYQPLGCDEVQMIQARVIATSNQCLTTAVRQRAFREDLFYRLNVLHLHVPPLRERPADIAALSQHFVASFGRDALGTPVTTIDPAAMDRLCHYDWPGNVRQLRNVIHRACVINESGCLSEGDCELLYAPTARTEDSTHFESLTLKEAERLLIVRALDRNEGNKTAAAKELGVTARTLSNKIKLYRDQGLPEAA